MLAHPTQERLLALGLTGMAKALDDQRRQPDIAALVFEERLALLLDRETIERENKRLPPACALPLYGRKPSSRMSICAHPAVSTEPCSTNWLPVIG